MASWNEIGKASTNSKSRILRIDDNKVYPLRPLGMIHDFWEYTYKHNGTWRYAICADPENCAVANTHNIRPELKFALNVWNYLDNEVWILKGKQSLFAIFRNYFDKVGTHAGGTHGANFEIKKIVLGNSVKYQNKCTGPHILTAEQMAYIKKMGGLYNLKNVFKPTDNDKIEEILFGDGIKKVQQQVQIIPTNSNLVVKETSDTALASKGYTGPVFSAEELFGL